MDIIDKIRKLKKQRNAMFLVHNYQLPEIQDIADFLGDSLGLSIKASLTDAEVIVFCGVRFMAETAKILSPQKKVILPEMEAGCPMADMITADHLRALKQKHPHAKVLCYVNTPAEVKAESDLCCTSANAVQVVKRAFKKEDEVIFVPDKYLADYASKQTGRKFITWEGYCPSHVRILPRDIMRQKKLHPRAKVMVHPECIPEVVELADEALSTEGMVRFVGESDVSEFVVGTEIGILHRLKKEYPQKIFYFVSEGAICPHMKLITLQEVLRALEEMEYEITIPEDIRVRAQKSIQEMLRYKG